MERLDLKCTYCGSNPGDINPDGNTVKCRYCNTVMLLDSAKKLAEQYRKLLREGEEIDLGRCRKLLSDMVNDNAAEERLALEYIHKILALVPDDFEAGYYKTFYQRRRDPSGYGGFLESRTTEKLESKEEIFAHTLRYYEARYHESIKKFVRNNFADIFDRLSLVEEAKREDEKAYARYENIKRNVFICHSSSDKEVVERFRLSLEREGISTWASYYNMPWDTCNYWDNITNAIDKCAFFAVVSSDSSMRRTDVLKELDIAERLSKPRIEFRIDDSANTYRFKEFFDGCQWIKLTDYPSEQEALEAFVIKYYKLKRQIEAEQRLQSPEEIASQAKAEAEAAAAKEIEALKQKLREAESARAKVAESPKVPERNPKMSVAPNYKREGKYILFGEYPQTLKADGVRVGTTPDSRGYYLGSDGAYYAKVTAAPHKSKSGYTFSTNAAVRRETVYYFKVEPIKWRILEESGGTALILCESIIANKRFADSSNNYANSEIRAWLNREFYNTAFSALQKALILTTLVDNSAATTRSSSNPYACADTNDKIFLPNYREMVNTSYGFSSDYSEYDTARRRLTSDYSRATGAYMSTDSSYYGNGFWWLRSPRSVDSSSGSGVSSRGYPGSDYGSVGRTYYGVVPALKIQLEAEQRLQFSNDEVAEAPKVPEVHPKMPVAPNYKREGKYIYFGEYPQTLKADSVRVGTTIYSRGYYLGSDGAYYAKVTAAPVNTFPPIKTVISGTVYYFKVEPIKWRILEESDGTALILCESIIANKQFDDDSNNYKKSEIRAWLNNQFYNTAFDSVQQALILTTKVDNSAATTYKSRNRYACANTKDKVFLLSWQDILNTSYGFSNDDSADDVARRRVASDYSIATGASIKTSDYYGNCSWLLRSPWGNYYASAVRYDGNPVGWYVNDTDIGVVPALKIQLS